MIRAARSGFVLACAVAGLIADAGLALAAPTDSKSRATGTAPAAIEWRDWSREAFDEAQAKKKLVLLDITATWCHWCRVMAEDSYTDSAVVAQVRANFIPIRVDYDLRPDIGDRYLTNGWPTTGVLSSNGHLLLSKTYLPPRDLQRFLFEAVHFYRANRQQVDQKVAAAERAVERTWEPDSLLPPTISEEEYIQRNIDALVASEDKVHGGFGSAPKTARWDAISFLLRAADAKRDDGLRALAVRATAAALALQDSVDGGFFRFALEPDWTKLRYERLLDEQAKALSTLTRVYRATGEARFMKAADAVALFVAERLREGADGDGHAWWNSAGPDIRRKDGSWVDGDVYFRLSREARSRTGSLTVARTATTGASARMASAYFAYNIAMRHRDHGRFERPVGPVPGEVREPLYRRGGGLEHATHNRRRFGTGLLADQIAVGHALLDAYEYRGKPYLLDRADSIAYWVRANLEDVESGGFRYAPRVPAAIGRLKAGDKPEATNAEAGLFFLRRYQLNGRQEDKDVADRTARFLLSGEKIVLDPARAELVLRLREEPVRLLVLREMLPPGQVTIDGGLWSFDKLWDAAIQAPVPEVVVRYMEGRPKERGPIAWPDGLPPDAVAPAIYRWTQTGWRGPVRDPRLLHEILDPPTPPR